MTSPDGVFEQQLAKAKAPKLLEDEPTIVVETTQGDESENPAQPTRAVAPPDVADLGNLFRNPMAHPLVLDLVLLKRYNTDWLGWEYETVLTRVTQDFNTPTISDVNVEKLQACKALHLVDDFWLKWEVFNACVGALNGSLADFRNLQVHTVPECMLSVDIANRIRNDVKWSHEVSTFLRVVHEHDGMLCPQPPLDFVHVPTEEFLGDYRDVQNRWPVVRASGKAPGGASIEDEQLRRMLGAYRYLVAARARFHEQLPVLQNG